MSMDHILPVPEGSEISLYAIELYNQWQCRNSETEDVLFIIYRDEKGEKHVHQIRDPAMEIFFAKESVRSGFMTPREYLPMEDVYSAKVPAKQVLARVYKELKSSNDVVANQLKKVYGTAIETGQFRAKKEILKWPYTLMSDMKVDEYYWVQLGFHYNTMHGKHPIDKCFADIENDVFGLTSSEQSMNMDPVNACTLIFGFDKNGPNKGMKPQVFTFLLRDHKRYPQQEYFEEHLAEFEAVCHEKFDKQTVIKKNKKKLIDVTADYHIQLFNDERDLLRTIFDTINKYKPDLCEFWNMPYDMPKMRARMEVLGMNPVEVMSDKDFFPKSCQFAQFHIDNRPIDIANRNSYIRMTSTTQYIDQMQNYASIRKGRKAYGSNSLDNIAGIELGAGKWKFSKKGVNVINASIKDYWEFVLYNIRDVWSQYLIDDVTNDSMALISDMNQHNCPLYHLSKQTKYQKYIYYCWYLRKGFVPGNNPNTNYSRFESEEDQERVTAAMKRQKLRELLDRMGVDPDDIEEAMEDPDMLALLETEQEIDDDMLDNIDDVVKAEGDKAYDETVKIFEDSIDRKLSLPGGLVGNPDLNSANGTELIPGIQSKHVFDDVMDEDYASEYPWAKFTRSLSKSTQIARLIIPHKVSQYQNLLPLGQKKRRADTLLYVPGAEFTADYISQDWLSFGSCWFNLPFVDEMNELVDKELGL